MLEPVPSREPKQLPKYHFQEAPEPNLPPFTVKVDDCPLQMGVVALADIAGADVSLTTKVKVWQTVLLQFPSART
jgi:hypothetical protein